jgi:hypothetical protein
VHLPHVVDEEARVPRVLVNHLPKEIYTASVSLPGKTNGLKNLSSKLPNQTLTGPYLSTHLKFFYTPYILCVCT